jgi:hypothetical protein
MWRGLGWELVIDISVPFWKAKNSLEICSWAAWPSELWSMGCSETSATNHQLTRRNSRKKREPAILFTLCRPASSATWRTVSASVVEFRVVLNVTFAYSECRLRVLEWGLFLGIDLPCFLQFPHLEVRTLHQTRFSHRTGWKTTVRYSSCSVDAASWILQDEQSGVEVRLLLLVSVFIYKTSGS